MTDNQLVVQTQQQAPGALATVLGVKPTALMDYAIEIATTLRGVLTAQGMTKKFGGQGEHVMTEGWQLAGSLLGLTVSEGPATELPDGSFEATVELRSMATQRTVAIASGRCGMDEPNWKGKPKYARRSMAYTRAIGRAYAQNFRWLIKLAGYEGTPAEEMPDFKPVEKTAPIYDQSKPACKQWLKQKCDTYTDDELRKISAKLHGRPESDVDDVVREFLAEASKI